MPVLDDDAGAVRHEAVDADRWSARGLVKVTGDANAGDATFEGNLAIGGKLIAHDVRYRGTVEVDGLLQVDGTLAGSGELHVGQTFRTGDADLKGIVKLGRSATVDRAFTVRGSLSVPSLTVGTLSLDGEAQIPGELSGTSISARLVSDSAFGTVHARSVSVRAKPPTLVEALFWGRIQVTVSEIEADEVELEGVDVEYVRAPKITLGRNAHITEYDGTIVRRASSSRVGFESRSRPPYGLRR